MSHLRARALSITAAAALALGVVGSGVPASAAEQTSVASSSVQAAAATSTVRTWAKRTYGTFTTWKRSGRGDNLLTIPTSVKAAVVVTTTDGESNFIVKALTSTNKYQDLLVNEIGAYSGTRVLGLEEKGKARRLQITADGAWTITLKPVWKASALPSSRTGDGVYLFNKRAGALKLTHAGSSNFVVWQHTGGRYGRDLLVNEIGTYKGTVPTQGGPSVIEVQADGRWTAQYR